MTVPQIFNHKLLKKRQARWQSDLVPDFISQLAKQYVDRLSDFNRDFKEVLLWGDISGQVEALLSQQTSVKQIEDVYEPTLDACDGMQAQSIDVVLSFGVLQWVNDVPGMLSLWKQVLKPDALLLTCFIGGQSLYELGTALQEAELDVLGGASGRVGPMIDAADYGQLLQRAGYALPVVDTDRITLTYDNFADLLKDVRTLGYGNVSSRQWRALTPPKVLKRAEDIYKEKFYKNGEWPLTLELIHGAAWYPAAIQQKALPVGSAKQRLADALDVKEAAAGEKAKP